MNGVASELGAASFYLAGPSFRGSGSRSRVKVGAWRVSLAAFRASGALPAKAQKPGAADAVFGISGPPMQAIFDQFCTPRERPYGSRGGGYSERPEYDPRDTRGEGKTLGPRRVEIETSRGGPVPERVKYVLLKVGGMWLVDSKTRNGLKATL